VNTEIYQVDGVFLRSMAQGSIVLCHLVLPGSVWMRYLRLHV
jgi:hypothetical protein